ncbi:MAG: ATP-binding cassette domain-containing protein [Lachnospiraceae bacterium]|nr:ATP-binding cassette domain-containing protein [Lachnospiraceae bacterium]
MLHAVDDIDLSIRRGTTLGVVGESGCGKSTLGRTILQLIKPTSGQIIFDGKDVTNLSKSEMAQFRRDAGIIFQDPYASLNPRLTAFELIEEPLIVNKTYKTKQEQQEAVFKMMEINGLPPRLINSYPHELDGGRRQRIGIARTLVLNPKFIVCDEPVSALDVSIQAQILNLLMDLQDARQLSYIFITHDLSVVKHISHEIMVMYMGVCVERAEKNELFANPIHPYTKALLAAIPVPDLSSKGKRREIIKGEVTSPINLKPGCRFAPRCPYACEKCMADENVKLRDLGNDHYVACAVI